MLEIIDKEKVFKLLDDLQKITSEVEAADKECIEAATRYIAAQKEWERINDELRKRIPAKHLTEEIKRS